MELGECNTDHAALGESNLKAQALSIHTGIAGSAMGSMKSRKGRYHKWLVDYSGESGGLIVELKSFQPLGSLR